MSELLMSPRVWMCCKRGNGEATNEDIIYRYKQYRAHLEYSSDILVAIELNYNMFIICLHPACIR